jgi:hypothetical protein
MTANKIDSSKAEISPDKFPALRQFLRGYLHQDWQDEYETPAEAAEQFCDDAEGEERQRVALEWIAFREQTKNLSLPATASLLSSQLGSSWHLQSPEELEAISAVFRPFAAKT